MYEHVSVFRKKIRISCIILVLYVWVFDTENEVIELKSKKAFNVTYGAISMSCYI
jgi:hypothetical protein